MHPLIKHSVVFLQTPSDIIQNKLQNMSTLIGFNHSIANKTTIEHLTHCHQFNTTTHFFFIVVYSVLFLVGLLLNGFILRFYFCQPQKTSSTMMVYLKNLTAADFLLSFSLLFYIINSTSSSMTIRLAYCKVGLAIFYLNIYASILFMTYIAANRYLKIIHPLKTHILQTVRAACIISAVTWVVLITMVISYSSVSLVVQHNSTSVPSSCIDLSSTKRSVLHKVIHSCILAIFLSILIFMVCVYYHTSRKVSMAQQSQLTSSSTKRLAKARRNMLVLVSVFCVCFVPYHLIHIPYIFLGCSRTQVLYLLQELSLVLSSLNVCLDPFIYFIFCKAFREQLKMKTMFPQGGTTTQTTERSNSHLSVIGKN
ncbi:P2Y purinoceptor 14-like [Sphaeramia orbicularis]|uniref:P2Y purinoceptor 14-like n=1 Tax=Sphaeramia orbicularis TaxID=375764 RepID=UPI0011805CA2|nr:P2Y purinoceptor 14-like [Sphaeramia orbicularis]